MLELRNVSFNIGKKEILKNVSAIFQPGELSMIIGPNGSGKTTLLRILSSELQASEGSVHYHDTISDPKHREDIARVRGVLSQHSDLSFPISVEEIVMMGRYPHFSVRPSSDDVEICTAALERVGISNLVGRNYLTLSGGERQMVQFARILAQIWERQPGRCRYLLLDEPITSLDIKHQHQFLEIARSFAAAGDIVVAVLHDVHLVAQYADFIIALKAGTKAYEGQRDEIIRPDILSDLYEINSRIVQTAVGKIPVFFAGNEP